MANTIFRTLLDQAEHCDNKQIVSAIEALSIFEQSRQIMEMTNQAIGKEIEVEVNTSNINTISIYADGQSTPTFS